MIRLAALTGAVVLCLFTQSCENVSFHRQVSFEGDRMLLPLDSLSDRQPQFYAVTLEGKSIKFFLMRVSGDVQSYFDACLTCYQSKRGFRENEGFMVCKSCGVKYTVEGLKTGVGGCYPIKLKGSADGKRYVITKDDLRQGLRYF